MINVLVVEDSPVQQELLVRVLNADPDITVMGTASNGTRALSFLARHKPDVITMDLNMPELDGLETTSRIMETYPLPIVIVSSYWDPQEATSTFRALDAGAVAGVAKPQGAGPDADDSARKVVQTVKAMAEVKVVRRWAHRRRPAVATTPPRPEPRHPLANIKLVAIGASTGGPPVLHTVLSGLPKDFAAPVLIVQHIAKGFVLGLAEWLGQSTHFAIHVPSHGDSILPGHVYLAPDDFHMGVDRNDRIALSQDPPESSVRPAVSHLFRSVAAMYGNKAAGVLLTGMGKDGARELRVLKDKGAITIAQDQESSVVYGMPGEAVRLGAATYELPPGKIAPTLTNLIQQREAKRTAANNGPEYCTKQLSGMGAKG